MCLRGGPAGQRTSSAGGSVAGCSRDAYASESVASRSSRSAGPRLSSDRPPRLSIAARKPADEANTHARDLGVLKEAPERLFLGGMDGPDAPAVELPSDAPSPPQNQSAATPPAEPESVVAQGYVPAGPIAQMRRA